MMEELQSSHVDEARGARKRNPDESKKRILDAAEKAFALRGFDGARLRDIANDAGVHHALVHHYFNDKRGLFREVLTRGLTRLSGLTEVRLSPGLPLSTNLERVVGPLYDFFSDNRDLLRVIEGGLRDRQATPFADASTILGGLAQPLVSQLQREIEAAQGRGEVRRDVHAKALMLFGLSALMTPFMVGSGLSAALGLPRPGDGPRASAKSDLTAVLTAALAPATCC